MNGRSPDQTVISISLPKELLERIDARSESLHMRRSHYLAYLAKTDVERGGTFEIDPGPDAKMMDFVKEITEFLRIAVPALAEYQRQKNDPAAVVAPSDEDEAEVENQFWNDFLDERDEILTLKWLESERAGADIGFERAIQLWLKHRPEWRAAHPSALG